MPRPADGCEFLVVWYRFDDEPPEPPRCEDLKIGDEFMGESVGSTTHLQQLIDGWKEDDPMVLAVAFNRFGKKIAST